MELEDLRPRCAVRGVHPDGVVTVVSVQWFGSEALELTYKTPVRRGRQRAAVPPRRGPARGRRRGAAVELRRRRRPVPTRVRGAAHPACASVRPAAGGPHVGRRPAAAPDHGRLRGDSAAPAAALPPRRRPGRGQDHHGGTADQGADRPRGPGALPDRLPGQPRRTVAGRAVPPVPASLRDPDQRQARSRPDPQLVPGDRPGHCPPRQAVARRGRAAEAAGADAGWDLVVCDEAHKLSATYFGGGGEVHEAAPAGPAPVGPDAPLPADDGDPAQRQGGGLPVCSCPCSTATASRAASATASTRPTSRT